MLKKTITYTNFNDDEVTETFWFNLTEAELADFQNSNPDGLSMTQYMQQIYDTKDTQKLYVLMKQILLMTYGEKSADGRHFRKSKEITDDFEHSAAYPVLFVELMSDANKASDFIMQCLPKKLRSSVPDDPAEVQALMEKNRG